MPHYLLIAITLASALAPTTAFAPTHLGSRPTIGRLAAASSFEEDLLLTIQVIRDHEARSTTVSTKQFLQQVKAAASVESDVVDIAVPYDSAALLAYEAHLAAGDGTTFADFKVSYVAETVNMVKAKKAAREGAKAPPAATKTVEAPAVVVVDIAVPYDAAARLAYEAAGSPGDFDAFKATYEADAVAMVTAKKTASDAAKAPPKVATAPAEVVGIAVPYDAAAKLAFEAAGSKGDFSAFKATYEAEAVAMVTAKKAASDAAKAPKKEAPKAEVVDISIPYDAAAMLAFEAAGSKGEFAAFKATYEAKAVAMVTAKKAAVDAAKAAPKKEAAPPKTETVDISVPYDAAAQLAYEAAGKPGDYGAFKTTYEAEAVYMAKEKWEAQQRPKSIAA
jgi:non-homologous end joining protein Ku